MTIFELAAAGRSNPYFVAGRVVLRAAVELFAHSLRHPRAVRRISLATGKVVSR
jgi:hypothetical protein